MIRNYFKIAWRNLRKNKTFSFINIGGLALGMTVSMLIGFWIWDELSFNKYNQHYDRIAQVMQNNTLNGEIKTWADQPLPLAEELRNKYGSDFSSVVMGTSTRNHILANGDKKLTRGGNFFEPRAQELMSLKMLRGAAGALNDPSSILLSSSLARALFGEEDPLDKSLKIDNQSEVKVTGVYEDLPANSTFREMNFIAPWALYLSANDWVKQIENPWGANIFEVYVQLAPNADPGIVSDKIKLAKWNHASESGKQNKSELFLYPMSKWHLYSTFTNGVISGGRIEFVWLFGTIGIFVLLLACINFMNLSTARSEKRAREVGIRKAIGSSRKMLVVQFLSESLLITAFAFLLALGLVALLIPYFNQLVDRKIAVLWSEPLFWLFSIAFVIFTGAIAGSYPALYLSSFRVLRILKGVYQAGQSAVKPRKVLVVFQFAVSVILIIGTIVVFRQIQFAKNRPVGYNREGLVMTKMLTSDIHDHFDIFRNELKNSGAISELAESSAPPTGIWATDGGFNWKGKDPNLSVDFPNTGVSYEYGKTVGWQFVAGRDFSRDFATDSSAFVINEAAVKFMGLDNPIGETINWDEHDFKIIGVIKDVVVESPYQAVRPSLYSIAKSHDNYLIAKLNPTQSTSASLSKMESIFKTFSPAEPFDFQFVDEVFGKKFQEEERISKLASSFAILAIVISCLGLFGMVSFVVEQRNREIAVRKVLGASVFGLWRLLSKEFAVLVTIALLIGSPVAWYFMHNWLLKYPYHTAISAWLFGLAGLGALLLALLTISYQALKAARVNPVKTLKSE